MAIRSVSAVAILAAVMVAIATPVAADEYESASHGVNNYGAAGECCSSCNDLSYAQAEAAAVYYAFGDISYTQNRYSGGQYVQGCDWTDGEGDDDDPYGTDWADAVFYSGHGTRKCDDQTGYYSELTMGANSPGTCDPKIGDEIQFANGGDDEDANALLLSACQSVQLCVWENNGYLALDQGGSGTQFTTLNGFHGITLDQSGTPGQLADYVTGAAYNYIGESWVTDLTDFNWLSSDECATSVIYGSSSAVMNNMFKYGGFRDFKDTGTHSASTFYFMCECNPDGGVTLPGC